MKREITCFIERTNINNINIESKIPKNIIQTYKNNHIHEFIYSSIMDMLKINDDYNYIFITDDIGINLINQYFDENILNAFNKLNVGAAKGDFLRYIAMYVYGGVYLDLDSNISISLNSFIDPNLEHLFFLDGDCNIQQWCFMTAANNPIILRIIQEMAKRIHAKEQNIFIATGPTLFTDVIYNVVNNSSYYNVTKLFSHNDKYTSFINNNKYGNGLILYEYTKNLDFFNKFQFRMKNYTEDMLYNNDKYIVTFDEETPLLYK